MGISLTAFKRTDTVQRYCISIECGEKEMHLAESIYNYSVKFIQKQSRRMGSNDIYTLYIGNNITKFYHLSLNMRQNNRYYRFGSYMLKISSKFVELFRSSGDWLLHHDNAPAHSSHLVQQFLCKHSIVLHRQPPYSPDIAL